MTVSIVEACLTGLTDTGYWCTCEVFTSIWEKHTCILTLCHFSWDRPVIQLELCICRQLYSLYWAFSLSACLPGVCLYQSVPWKQNCFKLQIQRFWNQEALQWTRARLFPSYMTLQELLKPTNPQASILCVVKWGEKWCLRLRLKN